MGGSFASSSAKLQLSHRARPALAPAVARAIEGGLAEHSIGGLYPFAVVGYGNGDRVDYGVENLQTGEALYDLRVGRYVRVQFAEWAALYAENAKNGTHEAGTFVMRPLVR
jgi:hypothetical protein